MSTDTWHPFTEIDGTSLPAYLHSGSIAIAPSNRMDPQEPCTWRLLDGLGTSSTHPYLSVTSSISMEINGDLEINEELQPIPALEHAGSREYDKSNPNFPTPDEQSAFFGPYPTNLCLWPC
jgi:hypothetical protein